MSAIETCTFFLLAFVAGAGALKLNGNAERSPEFEFEQLSHSEKGQDIYVYEAFFRNMTSPGVVLEMGVIDGLAGSNSYAFQKALKWRTVLVEANPTMKKEIYKNRKGADIHMNAICSEPGQLTFIRTTSPSLDCFAEYAEEDMLNKKLDEYQAKIVDKIPVDCKRLDGIGLPEVIDMFFLDVEGSELTVLKTMNFKQTCVRVWNIEGGHPNSEVGEFMVSNGFEYHGPSPKIPWDHIWVNPKKCK